MDVDHLVQIDAQLRPAIARFGRAAGTTSAAGKNREQVDIATARALKDALRTVTESADTLRVRSSVNATSTDGGAGVGVRRNVMETEARRYGVSAGVRRLTGVSAGYFSLGSGSHQ